MFGLIWDYFITQKAGFAISKRTQRHLPPASSQQQAISTQNTKGGFWHGMRRSTLLGESISRQKLSPPDPERGEGVTDVGEAGDVKEDQNFTLKGIGESEK